ncbi:type II toxin-antitoxin system RnlB family antitoxin [Sphingobacterium multivorum]|uniref:type II toxin-antitoxin system RnlB family antitoxin n=1 Tax=Sphingobacterium multivorum TaxID=28454 RepID=UPI0028ABE8B2|nr:type II toxin-antitoxin system RnlB family antitoxin [Sphingobacterium multivorum]
MKAYSIQKVSNGVLMVFSNTATRLDNLLASVNSDLQSSGYEGIVFFDMLLSNGNNRGRYFQSVFDGHSILIQTLSRLNEVPEEIKYSSKNYIKTHKRILNNGILTRREIAELSH